MIYRIALLQSRRGTMHVHRCRWFYRLPEVGNVVEGTHCSYLIRGTLVEISGTLDDLKSRITCKRCLASFKNLEGKL